MQEIFRLFIGIFNDLGDTKSPYLPRRMKIIENAATLKCYVILLDIGCEDLVLELFKTFFSVLRQVLPKTLKCTYNLFNRQHSKSYNIVSQPNFELLCNIEPI